MPAPMAPAAPVTSATCPPVAELRLLEGAELHLEQVALGQAQVAAHGRDRGLHREGVLGDVARDRGVLGVGAHRQRAEARHQQDARRRIVGLGQVRHARPVLRDVRVVLLFVLADRRGDLQAQPRRVVVVGVAEPERQRPGADQMVGRQGRRERERPAFLRVHERQHLGRDQRQDDGRLPWGGRLVLPLHTRRSYAAAQQVRVAARLLRGFSQEQPMVTRRSLALTDPRRVSSHLPTQPDQGIRTRAFPSPRVFTTPARDRRSHGASRFPRIPDEREDAVWTPSGLSRSSITTRASKAL